LASQAQANIALVKLYRSKIVQIVFKGNGKLLKYRLKINIQTIVQNAQKGLN
jgi:hypothetical protein